MALFVKSTKTRVSSQKGIISFEKFTTPISEGGEKAISIIIDIPNQVMKRGSITLYGDEVDAIIKFLIPA